MEPNNLGRIEGLLRHVGAERRAWADARSRFAERLAPDFNVLHFLRTDELGLSSLIAWLLDPTGSHAQGRRFLDCLLDVLELDAAPRAGPVAVRREAATDMIDRSSRRLDVRVMMDGFALGIENKPYAGWQERQLADYLEDLRQRGNAGYCLLVIKGWAGTAPDDVYGHDEPSAPAALRDGRHVIDTDYTLVARWLRDCIGLCRAPRVGALIGDMADFIDRKFGEIRDMDETLRLVRGIVDEPSLLASALTLVAARENLYREIAQRFATNVIEASAEQGIPAIVSEKWLSDPSVGRVTAVDFDLNPTKPWTVSIGFHWPALGAGHMGLKMRDGKEGRGRKLGDLLGSQDEMLATGTPDGAWIVWSDLTELGIDAFESEDRAAVWPELLKASVARSVVDTVCRYRDAIVKVGEL